MRTHITRGGGVIFDPHNFAQNKNRYSISFNQYINHILTSRHDKLSEEKINILNNLFGDLHKHNQYSAYYDLIGIENRVNTLKGDEPDATKNTCTLNKMFDETIKQNIIHFYQLLDLIYRINPNMKLTLLLIPRYYEAQQSTKKLYEPWKAFFYSIINNANKEYPFQFLDLKDCEVSRDKLCFQDTSHLNYYGAVRFTNLLKSHLFKTI